MNKEDIKNTFTELIENLKISINNLKTKKEKISQELKKYHAKITIEELEKTLPMILKKVQKWNEFYTKTKDLLSINIKEYSNVLKE